MPEQRAKSKRNSGLRDLYLTETQGSVACVSLTFTTEASRTVVFHCSVAGLHSAVSLSLQKWWQSRGHQWCQDIF